MFQLKIQIILYFVLSKILVIFSKVLWCSIRHSTLGPESGLGSSNLTSEALLLASVAHLWPPRSFTSLKGLTLVTEAQLWPGL